MLAVPQPPGTNDFLVDRAIWHFCRGLALLGRGDTASAEREQVALATLAGSGAAKELSGPMFPVSDILQIPTLWLAGRVAGAKGDTTHLFAQLQKAIAAEDAMPYMEPTYWPVPVRPALGAALLRAGDAVQAERIFREDIQRWPRNGWGLYGLEQALQAQAKKSQAADVHRQFEEAWRRADVKPNLNWY